MRPPKRSEILDAEQEHSSAPSSPMHPRAAKQHRPIRRVSGDPVRMESIFSFQAGGAGAAAPRSFLI